MRLDNVLVLESIYNKINYKEQLGLFEMLQIEEAGKEIKESRKNLVLLANEMEKQNKKIKELEEKLEETNASTK